jgi:4-alpha-glucanotransferase
LIELEAGESSRFAGNMTSLEIQATHESGGELYTEWRLPLPPDLPWGYHRLSIRWSGKEASVLLIRAPRRAAGFPDDPDPGRSGLFLPLYALRTRHDWGAGDFSDLSRFSDWAGENGFEAVGTLPLLPTFLEEPFDPSPYAPVSRQFWGEHFIDPRVAPEFGESKEAGAIVRSANFQAEVETLRQRDTVDYARLWALKRPVLEALSAGLRRDAEAWERRVSPWVRKKPEVMAYATFRAVQEKHRGRNWRLWPEAQRSGNLEGASLDPAVIDFYLYTQMLAHEQLGGRTDAVASAKAPLYLDLPLGSHPDGFDRWREQDSFAEGMAVGAPPDPLFTGGQDWGFAPMHPGRVRTRGYRYFIACLRHHLAASKILRLDHAMGFHRLFWIPAGMGAEHGVYVHYKAEEFYAILSLESRRHGVALVGEDLGTVPGQVRTAMDRHGISRTYAMQLELREETDDAMGEIPEQAAACINTHDLPPFAAFWTGEDIEQLAQLGFYEEADRVREHERRAALRQSLMAHLRQKGQLGRESDSPGEILMGCLRILRNSPAAMTLVTLEDLWEERRRQNLPGSTNEVPNWRHRSRFSLEDFDAVENVQRLIREIALRPGRPGS